MDEPAEAPIPDSPDIMNDPAFAPPRRQDTASSKHGSEGGGETCRICRSEGTPEEPLFYPCKCNGSIKFVHQECLMEWLSHSHKKHCELCKTPFRFTKLYDANMPKTLPWTVFVRKACMHVFTLFLRACRATMVGFVWLAVLPWLIRWGWRCMFYCADAGWARESFLRDVQAQWAASHMSNSTNATTSVSDSLYAAFENIWEGRLGTPTDGAGQNSTMDMTAEALSSALKNVTSPSNSTSSITHGQDTSILSSWTYLAHLTSNSQANRVIVDIFEGQLITCVVIIGFILVFLIREWVVQQQPLVNLDIVNNEQRERDRIERETERLQQQVELLHQARARLVTLQEEARNEAANEDEDGDDSSIAGEEFVGWERFSSRLDEVNGLLRSAERAHNMDHFRADAHEVLRQMRIAERTGVSVPELVEVVYQKLATFSEDERLEWEDILVDALEQINDKRTGTTHSVDESAVEAAESEEVTAAAQALSGIRRPQMPDRDTSFLATEVQRSLAELEDELSGTDDRHPSGGRAHGGSGRSTAGVTAMDSEAGLSLSASSDGSWQHLDEPAKQEPVMDHVDIFQDNKDEMPITNAGQDAKTNIGRSGKIQRRPVVPEPDEVDKVITNDELNRRLEGSGAREGPATATSTLPAADQQVDATPHADNPFHPEGPPPDADGPGEESLRERVASVFREEFGLDEAEDLESTLR